MPGTSFLVGILILDAIQRASEQSVNQIGLTWLGGSAARTAAFFEKEECNIPELLGFRA